MKKAFSLIELAITLSIIALLVAAVTTASKLSDYTRLNKLISEIQEIHNSYDLFTLTYTQRPGDFAKAENFWGSTDVDNGDGDGKVEWSSESYNTSSHLVKAKLIVNRSYSNNLSNYKIKFDAMDASATIMHSLGQIGFSYAEKETNFLQVGAKNSNAKALLLPKDAQYIDKKIDDGKARSGNIIYRNLSGIYTTDASCTGSGSDYDLTLTAPGCNILYQLQ